MHVWTKLQPRLIIQPKITRIIRSNHTDVRLIQSDPQQRRLDIWTCARDAQQRSWCTPYVEKISVAYSGQIGEQCQLQVTKGLSTPSDCAQHLSRLLVEQSAIALVNGKPWSMHCPLVEDCTVDFVHYKDAHHDPTAVNSAFWRSASLLLAATVESAFRPEHGVRLVHIHPTTPDSGSFVCDFTFIPSSQGLWLPSEQELRAISAHGQRLASMDNGVAFEPLHLTDPKVIESCYVDEPVRLEAIREEFSTNASVATTNSTFPPISLYRIGSFVEACGAHGPLINSTRQIGRFALTDFRPIGWLRNQSHHSSDETTRTAVYRAQGLALPTAFLTHFSTFDRLLHSAREPNPSVPKAEKLDHIVQL